MVFVLGSRGITAYIHPQLFSCMEGPFPCMEGIASRFPVTEQKYSCTPTFVWQGTACRQINSCQFVSRYCFFTISLSRCITEHMKEMETVHIAFFQNKLSLQIVPLLAIERRMESERQSTDEYVDYHKVHFQIRLVDAGSWCWARWRFAAPSRGRMLRPDWCSLFSWDRLKPSWRSDLSRLDSEQGCYLRNLVPLLKWKQVRIYMDSPAL